MKLEGHKCCMCGEVQDYTLCDKCKDKLPDAETITIPSNDGLVTDEGGSDEKH